jgi:glyoxylase-like metal-dependent hydrolase (beta-lactamase superfamily II)
MKIREIGKRGTLFTFDDLNGFETNCYLINCEKYIFVVDTFLGPQSMEGIKDYIESKLQSKPVIVFNSHFHFDHIWGNCAFKGSIIISHDGCRKLMEEYSNGELEEYGKYKKGEVNIVYPNLTFTDKLIFEEEGIEFFHTPGHSDDSASFIDRVDRVLFVGDNIESPIPYLCTEDLDRYIATLESYCKTDVEFIVCGHCDGNRALVERNLDYVKKFKDRNVREFEEGECSEIHRVNLQTLGFAGRE